MDKRGYNFCAGPAALPEVVLKEAQAAMLNWNGLGASVLEVGHRSQPVEELMAETLDLFREILDVPDNFEVMILGGAGRDHFGNIPLNYFSSQRQGAYLVTGIWSKMAYEEAQKLSHCQLLASGGPDFISLPQHDASKLGAECKFVYYCANETVNGNQYHTPPETNGRPLLSDMTSCILSERIDFNKHALVFAGAQKNIANAGMSVAIISKDLLENTNETPFPKMMDYRTFAQSKSLYATPPVFNCFVTNRTLHWLKSEGGVSEIQKVNRQKAALLYDFIDNSTFYRCDVEKSCRSVMNVCFHLEDESLMDDFLRESHNNGLLALKGHRAVGGLRASIYNAMPLEGVEALVTFMKKFEMNPR